jgi:hypothetical protein
MIKGLEKLADELPHLRELRAELESVLHATEKHRSLYLKYHARALSEAQRLREAQEKGRRLESRIRASLKGIYGADSLKLIRFGLKPHRGMKQPALPTEGPEEPELPEGGEE